MNVSQKTQLIRNCGLCCMWMGLGLGLFLVCFDLWGYKDNRDRPYKIKPIIENNSETIGEMAYVFDNLVKNTSIMMRYSHYLDNHDPAVEIVPFCPECTKAEDELLPIEKGKQDELPSTLEQLTQDSYEIKMSVERIKNSLHNQKFKLQYTLDRLKEIKNEKLQGKSN